MSEVPSPCIDVCRMDPDSGWCTGCLRTIDEIAAWGRLDDDAKRDIVQAIGRRRESMGQTGSTPAPPVRC